jgi:hypothetical protein
MAEELEVMPQKQGVENTDRQIPFNILLRSLSFHYLLLNDHYYYDTAYSAVISFHYWPGND